jgi:hypothetical protein
MTDGYLDYGDHMWIPIEEGYPDGCVDLEVIYKSGERGTLCSCDLHWKVYQKKELPEYFRRGIEYE